MKAKPTKRSLAGPDTNQPRSMRLGAISLLGWLGRCGLLLQLLALGSSWQASAAPVTPGRVLILADTVWDRGNNLYVGSLTFDPRNSLEARIARSLGFIVDYAYNGVVPGAGNSTTAGLFFTPSGLDGTRRQWSTIPQNNVAPPYGFSQYRAVLFCDANFFWAYLSNLSGPTANTAVWGPAIQGNIIVDGEDFTAHAGGVGGVQPGAYVYLTNAIQFVTSSSSGCTNVTGLYASMSGYYQSAGAPTPVPVLNYFGAFTAQGGGYDQVLITASHPALTALTAPILSYWAQSSHETFPSFPATFLPLAIVTDPSAAKNYQGLGSPYILARSCDGLFVPTTSACLTITNRSVDCMATNSTYAWTFLVTNRFNGPIGFLSFPDLPAGVTISQDILQLNPVLQNGQGTKVTLYITNTPGLTNICFTIGAHSTNFAQCCSISSCLTFAPCCAYVASETMTAAKGPPPNCYNYYLTIKNVSMEPVSYLFFTPDPYNSCTTFNPDMVHLPTPLLPGQTTTLPAPLKVCMDPTCPKPLCFLVSLHNSNLVQCCSTRHCLPPPTALPIGVATPVDGTLFLTPATIPLTASLGGDITFTSVNYLANDVVVASSSTPPYSAIWSNAPAGDYVLRADGVETNGGGMWISDPVTIYVRTDQDATNAPPVSAPALTSLKCAGNALSFCLPTTTGATYYVEYTDSLSAPNWTVLQTIVGDGSTLTVTNTVSNAPRRFYRVRVDH